ncbi:DUF2510 domain-containing protein [Actinoplanes siamensis]|uniref:DUF2510 domain-containing protein n=1 Tax=Actinoplanes siamensis TaxID=1223317 RepID=A0A919TLX7_9ACTN|nr:DUF2510 domain-containing protein [Actinoplanes siamensis]GIF06924.1 hypothetical protein Asi03nite_44620 [Actinoplanes siamensis]
MRKFLLWLATMWVGMITFVVVFTTLIGASSGAGTFLGSLVLWLFALAGGIALSAPAFLNPPDDNGGVWYFRLPLPLWMFLMMMKLMSWIGFQVLLGAWILIFKVRDDRQNKRLPAFSNGAQQPGAQQPPFAQQPPVAQQPPFAQQPQFAPGPQPGAGPQPPPAGPPASWQADPTGRFRHRWWDGARWTDRVANGTTQTTDPL